MKAAIDFLNEETVKDWFGPNGPLPVFLPHFEARESQMEMAALVARSLNESKFLAVEAGTGVGKSWAYLLPAIVWAKRNNKRLVISTHTIALQEQIALRDLPTLLQAFDIDVSVQIAKGMNNYTCLRKLEALHSDPSELSHKVQKDLQKTYAKANSLQDLPPPQSLKRRIHCEKDACNNQKCSFYRDCFFFKARKKLSQAEVIITNHHMLLLDLKRREEENVSILPEYDALIVDEAHHLESVCTKAFAKSWSEKALRSLLESFVHFHPKRGGALFKLLEKAPEMLAHNSKEKDFNTLQKQNALLKSDIEGIIAHIERLKTLSKNALSLLTQSIRLGQKILFKNFSPEGESLAELESLIESLISLEEKLASFFKTYEVEDVDVSSLCKKLTDSHLLLKDFFFPPLAQATKTTPTDEALKWLELSPTSDLTLSSAHLSAQKNLKALFEPLQAATLCSATLKAGSSFDAFFESVGLNNKDKNLSACFSSPFDYENKTRLFVPTDLPSPMHPTFIHTAFDLIKEALKASKGSAFILFTSYDMLDKMHRLADLDPELEELTLLRQGTFSRTELLDNFRDDKKSVLFGTDSFWEGVDVAGSMRLLILVKLPFPSITEPLYEARMEELAQQGKNGFMDYALPQATMKFKQGFGRLIRSKRDEGCIICLDSRLIQKAYGKRILKSLPPSPLIAEPSEAIIEKLKAFYQK